MAIRSLVAVLMSAALFLAATGCQNAGTAPAAASPTKAVIVSAGQGGSTTIYVPNAENTGVLRLASEDSKACPQCEADALAYFKTGQLSPKCPVCGASRVAAHAIN